MSSVENCRFYSKELPEVDDLVKVRVKNLEEFSAVVELIEYANIEAYLTFSEVSSRRIRSLAKHIRVNKDYVCSVVRIDVEKQYIDVSRKRVRQEDSNLFEKKFQRAKATNSLMHTVSRNCGIPLTELYEKIVWPLNNRCKVLNEYAYELNLESISTYEILSFLYVDSSELDALEDVPEGVKEDLLRLSAKHYERKEKLQANFKVESNKSNAVVLIRESMLQAYHDINKELHDHLEIPQEQREILMDTESDHENVIDVRVIAPPVYSATLTVTDIELGLAMLNKFLARVTEIMGENGNVEIEHQPTSQSINDIEAFTNRLKCIVAKMEEDKVE
ncbi:hypothetical protein PCE1_000611 [Barthelona sp. PCE]